MDQSFGEMEPTISFSKFSVEILEIVGGA